MGTASLAFQQRMQGTALPSECTIMHVSRLYWARVRAFVKRTTEGPSLCKSQSTLAKPSNFFILERKRLDCHIFHAFAQKDFSFDTSASVPEGVSDYAGNFVVHLATALVPEKLSCFPTVESCDVLGVSFAIIVQL